jgi:TatD DNase family protein
MGLIDTHTHLDAFSRRGELPAVLTRARAAGIDSMVAIGTDTDDWRLYADLAREYPGVVNFTVGLHPCSVGEDWAGRVAQLDGFWGGAVLPADAPRIDTARPENGRTVASVGTPCPVALGETGLDRFHLPKDDAAAAERILDWQRAAFAESLELATRRNCPVVVHSRGAFRECVEMIDASGVDWARVVFHCFTEGPEEMAELTRRGGYGSFTGIITYKTADPVRAAARAQGLDRLMLETDAPYLTPMPHRGKPNEPAYLRHTAEYCALLFGVSYERLVEVTTANARKFYRL